MDDAWRKAQHEAADWLILLREEPEDAGLAQHFEHWLDADPLHVRAWASVEGVFEAIGDHPPPPAATAEPARRRWPNRRLVGASAGLALAACLAFAILPWARLHWQADVITGAGETRDLRLADGSRVRLGPESALALPGQGHDRTVRLLAGQAWFEVKHDPAAPFRVRAGHITAIDVGTAFDVRRMGKVTSVAVAQGAVRVLDLGTAPATTRSLTAGQWVSIARDHALIEGQEAPGLVGAWRNGTVVIRNRTLSEAIQELRPWYGGGIILTDAAFGQQRIDGVYDARSPAVALDALVLSRGGVVRHVTPWLMIVSAH
ncbi:FecR family protein [Novosphingobium terrae]|uniref:FecR family protein n=1 Tax=Novosphingobium terrae TaxID=2726189 RepID=UPI00197CF57F|nr:FecR domain-containing protein [Novosphingobium terrae]